MEDRKGSVITINGTEYVPVEDAAAYAGVPGYDQTDHVCVIADRGWIFEGRMREDGTLAEAHVVRKWSNGLGIGGLADPAHKDEYTLDAIGDLRIAPRAVIAEIPLRW